MKKQILFLALFLVALLAGKTGAYAQQVDTPYLDAAPASCPIPTPLTNCGVGDPLHPVAGVNYNYIIDQSGGAGSVVHWFVADDSTPLITAAAITATIDPGDGLGDYVLLAESGVYNQGTTAGTPNTAVDIDIRWKAFDGTANNVVLVAFVTDAIACTNNIQAWRIEPQYSFIIEIAGLQDGGAVFPASGGTNASECVSPVQLATWNGTSIAMDYGDNYIFYNVTAANYIHGWLPSFSAAITGGLSTQNGTIEWAYADEATGATSVWHPVTDPVLAAHYTGLVVNDAIGPDGACIVLRVNVDHAAVEELATTAEQVTMTVDGLMWNSETSAYDAEYPDLDDAAASGGACVVGSTDTATYDITPRPNITPDTPTDPFVIKN